MIVYSEYKQYLPINVCPEKQNYRSTEPMIQHPEKPKNRRLLTPVEHARVKSIPETLVNGLSATIAHQILGQSVLHSAFVSVGRLLGAHLKKISKAI